MALLAAGLLLIGPATAVAQLNEEHKASVVKIVTRGSATKTGAGFVIRRNADAVTILTAAHVVADADDPNAGDITVYFYAEGRGWKAEVRDIELGNMESGMALLLVTGAIPSNVNALNLNASLGLNGGEPVNTIGHQASGGEWGVLSGTVVGRAGRVLRIQVPVAQQASGGPVLHKGEVVGLVMQTDQKLGFGRAVPADVIRSYAGSVPGALATAGTPPAQAGTAAAAVGRPPLESVLASVAPPLATNRPPPPAPTPTEAAPSALRDCTDCPELVLLPAGTFTMGASGKDPEDTPAEQPSHEIRIAVPFAMGRAEVTRAEFSAFVQATGYQTDAERGDGCSVWGGLVWEKSKARSWRDPGFVQTPPHPVVCVSWNDAQAYVRWLSQKSGNVYRLPTEAEWEFAASRALGGSPARRCESTNGADVSMQMQVAGAGRWPAGKCNDGYAFTAPVDALPDAALGLRHLLGNAAEWVQDAWHESYTGAPGDGSEWRTGADTSRRVVRGGSWADPPRDLRPASRDWYLPESRDTATGFRVARTL